MYLVMTAFGLLHSVFQRHISGPSHHNFVNISQQIIHHIWAVGNSRVAGASSAA